MDKELLKEKIVNFIKKNQILYSNILSEAFILSVIDNNLSVNNVSELIDNFENFLIKNIEKYCDVSDLGEKKKLFNEFNFNSLNEFFPFDIETKKNKPIINQEFYIEEENFGERELKYIKNSRDGIQNKFSNSLLYDTVIIPHLNEFVFRVYYGGFIVDAIAIINKKTKECVGGCYFGTSVIDEGYREKKLGSSLVVVNYYSNLFLNAFYPTHFSKNGFFSRLSAYKKIHEMIKKNKKLIIKLNDLDSAYQDYSKKINDLESNFKKIEKLNKINLQF